MPQQVEWLVQDTVLLQSFTGEFTKEDLETSQHRAVELTEQSMAPMVYSIADGTHLEKITFSPLEMLRCESLKAATGHPRSGHVVFVVSPNPIYNFFLRLFGQVKPNRFRLVNSMEEAIDYLGELTTFPEAVIAAYRQQEG